MPATPTTSNTASPIIAAAAGRARARRRRALPPARSRARSCRACPCAARSSRWARTKSTARIGTGTRSARIRSSARTPSRPSSSRAISTACARPVPRCGAVIEVVAEGVPAGLGAPVYAKLDADLAGALMGINAVKGVEIGDGFATAAMSGEDNADEMRKIRTWAMTASRCSCPTTPAAFSAASRPGSKSSRALRSSRPRRS